MPAGANGDGSQPLSLDSTLMNRLIPSEPTNQRPEEPTGVPEDQLDDLLDKVADAADETDEADEVEDAPAVALAADFGENLLPGADPGADDEDPGVEPANSAP